MSIFSRPSAYMCLYSAHWMYGAGLLPVRRDRLPLATRKVYSGFSTVFLSLLLLAAGSRVSCCLFLEMKSFCLLKYSKSRIAQARGVQGEENQDQSTKGCSVNSER